ncbi:hypothetical protein K8S19_00775 [bacterium]|nr:hypothetical protein [bacterium]
MKKTIMIIMAALIAGAGFQPVTAMGAELSGYYEGQLTGYAIQDTALWQMTNRLRIDLSADVGENASMSASLAGMTYHGYTDMNLLEVLPEDIQSNIVRSFGTAVDTLFHYTYEETAWSLENAFLTFYPGAFTIRIGRQQLPWGTGYAWNPSDIFNTKSLLDPAYEKSGQDALKVEWGFGESGGIVLVYQPGVRWQDSTRACKVKVQAGSFDLSASIIDQAYDVLDVFSMIPQTRETRRIVAMDFVGQAGDFGVWGEGVFFQGPSDTQNWQLVLGADTTFEFQTSLMVEYFRDWQGTANAGDYDVADWVDLIMGQRITMGRDYAMLMISHPVHDFIDVTLMTVMNCNDRSFGLIPTIAYTYSDDVVITLVGNIFGGSSGSEYGGLDTQGGYLRVKAYF